MNALLETLKKTVEGLLYMSETDAPVAPVLWPQKEVGAEPLTPERLRALAKQPDDAPVETRAFEEFFAPLVTEEDWYGDEEKAEMRRWQELQRVLQEHLENPAVYRVGETQLDIYILGRTAEGDIAGVHTQAVET